MLVGNLDRQGKDTIFKWVLRKKSTRRRIARLMQRVPALADTIRRGYRLFQPRVTMGAVGVLLNAQNQIFLLEHVFHGEYPWGLPGGWVDRHELPAQAVEREFLEETGLVVKSMCQLEIWMSREWRGHVDFAFAVELATPEEEIVPQLSYELIGYKWVNRQDLPAMLPVHQHVIDLAIERKLKQDSADRVNHVVK